MSAEVLFIRLLSGVVVACGKLQSENIKWKITEKPSEVLIVLIYEIRICDLPSERLWRIH